MLLEKISAVVVKKTKVLQSKILVSSAFKKCLRFTIRAKEGFLSRNSRS
jgi:hypothetical protein